MSQQGRERERERERDTHTHTHAQKRSHTLVIVKHFVVWSFPFLKFRLLWHLVRLCADANSKQQIQTLGKWYVWQIWLLEQSSYVIKLALPLEVFNGNRVRRPRANPQINYGPKYWPTCHQWYHADVTRFHLGAIVTASVACCWHSDVVALSHYKRQKSALTANPIKNRRIPTVTRPN